MNKKRLHIVTNTHWDREHRTGFQENRYALVEMVDKLIDIMENDPDFKYFIFDGQTIVIEDYLEIKPHMKDRLKALIESGRILIGPWTSLPDHFAISPESIIRNILRGDRASREFGNKMNFGYSIFSFGQMAQLPQIYAGFGINEIIFYKRFSAEIMNKAEFIWEAPDGTRLLASRMGEGTRYNFFFHFTIPVILGGNAYGPDWKVAFTDGTKLTHLIDDAFRSHHATELQTDIRIRKEKIAKAIEDVMDDVSNTLAESVFMAFDGVDFSAPLKEIPAAIKEANKIVGDEIEIIHSNPVDYFKELREEIDLDSLMTYMGEMRFGPINSLHAEAISANIKAKQKNHRAEKTILNYAEPFSAFNKINGGIYPTEMLLRTWKFLFGAHHHDAIHSSGVAKIKRDELYRLAQAQEIAEGMSRRAFEAIVSKISNDKFEDDDILITVFNPTKYERNEVINLKVDLPRDEHVTGYTIEDLDGRELEIFEYDSNYLNMASINAVNRPKKVLCERVDVDLLAKDIPSFGYKTFKLNREKGFQSLNKDKQAFANPAFPYDPIGKSPDMLDNGLLRVKVNQNGTIDITDLETGSIYEGLNVFTDTGSSGDMWIHREPVHNQKITSYGNNAEIALVKNSYLSATLKIDVIFNIPDGLTEDRKSRSCYTTPTTVSTEVTLAKNSKRADFKVCLENKCKEHKLIVSFPTGIKTDFSRSQAPFEIKKRPIENTSNVKNVLGEEAQRHPMHDFIDISDQSNGLSLFTKGLKEFETRYYDEGKVQCDLTLIRGVTQSFAVHGDVFIEAVPGDEPAQCLGKHQFEYSLLPHKGDCLDGDVIAAAEMYVSPVAAAQHGKGNGGELPAEVSFVKSSNRNTIINCIKKAEDNDEIIVRITNPIEKPVKEKLEFYNKIKQAFIVNLNEEKDQELAVVAGHNLELKIPPYKIVTLSLDF